jgi:hypothetical protein
MSYTQPTPNEHPVNPSLTRHLLTTSDVRYHSKRGKEPERKKERKKERIKENLPLVYSLQ